MKHIQNARVFCSKSCIGCSIVRCIYLHFGACLFESPLWLLISTTAVILGPIGLLVGAASAGIGMGVMQIPEEHRNNVCNRAASSIEKAREYAYDLSENVSSSCGKFYGQETGSTPDAMGNAVHHEIVDRCCSMGEEKRRGGDDGHSLSGTEAFGPELRTQGSSPIASAVNGVGHGVKGLVGDVFGDEHASPSHSVGERHDVMMSDNESVGRRVACGRKGETLMCSK